MNSPLLGGWHSVAEAEVKKLGAALARQSGQEEGEVLRHLWGCLGLLPQRGNAANRLPTFPAPAVDGFLQLYPIFIDMSCTLP